MTTKFIKSIAALLLLSASACQYSEDFTGTFNQKPATLNAYSRNIEKDCIRLTLKSDAETLTSAIGADAVFDENDPTRGKSFNTKGSPCGSKLNEYLVGTRSTKIINVVMNARETMIGNNLCQRIYYTQYFYQDTIQFEFRNNLSDLTTGSFVGTGQVSSYTDFNHPNGYSGVYFCNGVFPGNSSGYPDLGPYPLQR